MPGIDAPPPSKRKKTDEPGRSSKPPSGYYVVAWEKEWPGIIAPSELGKLYAFCKICSRDVKVSASGRTDVRRHMISESHKRKAASTKGHKPLTEHFVTKDSTSSAIEAEVLFCHFIAEHNLPASVADHFTDLVGKMFPDSKIARDFACKRTKATQIIKKSLAPSYTEPVVSRCQTGPFSLLIDESNDKNDSKRLVILVRVFEGESAKTRLLDMPVACDGTAQGIFNTLEQVIVNYAIPWKNMIGFASDNCNVMIGKDNSVLSRLRQKNPNIFNIGCICHLVNLAVKSGAKKLTMDIDQLLVDIFYFFKHSSKRRDEYKEFQLFVDVDDLAILKHCPTRWLSLDKVVKRTLNQLPALISYFSSHEEVEKKGKVKQIHDRLQNPLTRLTLQFLDYILPVLNNFNTIFQADESRIGYLSIEMDRLLRKLICKFVQMKHVKGVDILKIEHKNRSLQHDDQILAVGVETRTFILEQEVDPKVLTKFFDDVREFYSAVVDKMIKKFPFKDPILPDLKVLDPSKRESLSYSHIVNLATKFCPSIDQEDLKEEWEDFQLLADEELPTTDEDGKTKRMDALWSDILRLTTSLGTTRFPLMGKLLPFLLCLPNSNAECERVFSMVRKIHTEYRKSLAPETLTAFLQMKLNCDSQCFQVKPQKDVLAKSKVATSDYNNNHK